MIYFQSLTKDDLAALILPLSRGPSINFKRPRVWDDLPLEEQAKIDADLERKAVRQSKYRAQQIYHWVYQRFVTDWDQMTDFPRIFVNGLRRTLRSSVSQERVSRQAMDGTHKFLWDLSDRKTIESVIIPAALQEKKSVDGEVAP